MSKEKTNDTSIECEHCEYNWLYSGSQRRATCPSCGISNRTMDQQKGLYVDEETKIDLSPYSYDVFVLLKRAIEIGDDEYRDGLKEVFPTI